MNKSELEKEISELYAYKEQYTKVYSMLEAELIKRDGLLNRIHELQSKCFSLGADLDSLNKVNKEKQEVIDNANVLVHRLNSEVQYYQDMIKLKDMEKATKCPQSLFNVLSDYFSEPQQKSQSTDTDLDTLSKFTGQ